METTLEQRQARIEVAGIMQKREDSPLIGTFTDCQGKFCAMGLIFETLRQKEPDILFWYNDEFAINTHHPEKVGLLESNIRVYKRIQKWLGLSKEKCDFIVDLNDDWEYDWYQISDELLSW